MDCLTKFVKFFFFPWLTSVWIQGTSLILKWNFTQLYMLLQQVELRIFQVSLVPELKWYKVIPEQYFFPFLYIIHLVQL